MNMILDLSDPTIALLLGYIVTIVVLYTGCLLHSLTHKRWLPSAVYVLLSLLATASVESWIRHVVNPVNLEKDYMLFVTNWLSLVLIAIVLKKAETWLEV